MARLLTRYLSAFRLFLVYWLNRLGDLGALPEEGAHDRLRKSVIIFIVVLLGIVVLTLWVVLYWILDLKVAAAVPFTFQLFSVMSLIYLARTKDFATFRSIEFFMALTLPVSLQWALGASGRQVP